jgi:hypothetical protein
MLVVVIYITVRWPSTPYLLSQLGSAGGRRLNYECGSVEPHEWRFGLITGTGLALKFS